MIDGPRGEEGLADSGDPDEPLPQSRTEVDPPRGATDVDPPRVIGLYELHDRLGSGGMATVHFGRKRGPAGFARLVAIKRLLPQLAEDDEFVRMFLDEARLAARVSHPNVVQTLDVQVTDGEFLLALEYVHGQALHLLAASARARGERIPPEIAARIGADVLEGLHAAHEATGERGVALCIVHRDISPHNVMVGVDGVARVLDFGIAKASERAHVTADGKVKGKLRYMSPEQLAGEAVDRRTDLYASSVVLWELLSGARFLETSDQTSLVGLVLHHDPEPPSAFGGEDVRPLDSLVLRGLRKDPSERFASAREMLSALERAVALAPRSTVSAWVHGLAADSLAARDAQRRRVEATVIDETGTVTIDRPARPGSRAPSKRRPLDAQADHETGSVSATRDVPPARRRLPRLLVPAGVALLMATGLAVRMLGPPEVDRPVANAGVPATTAQAAFPPAPAATSTTSTPAVEATASSAPPGTAAAPTVTRAPARRRATPAASSLPPVPSASAPPRARVLDPNGLMPEGR